MTVTDQSDDQDTFERLILVTDQYCSINSASVDKHITHVSIGGNDINYNSTAWDYTQMPIELINPSNTIINIQGDTGVTERSTSWKVRIDLNDNGIYGDEANELVVDKFVEEGQPYGLNTTLDLSTLPNSRQAKFMRIIGDYTVFGPCSSSIGEALDLSVSWQ